MVQNVKKIFEISNWYKLKKNLKYLYEKTKKNCIQSI